jgi:hypothetical protein
MAAGFRSMAAFWIGGIATGAGAPPEPSCPCPDWTVEATLSDSFKKEQTLLNAFAQKAEQSTNRWHKKNCE